MAETAATILRRPAPTVAVTGVSLVDVRTGTIRPGMTILSRGSLIQAVAPDGRITLPAGTYQVYFGLYSGSRRLAVKRGPHHDDRVQGGPIVVR
jgi:hypothetical protein